ncbi:MAG: F0F1 ATP synthase subunit B [bacterium]|nr:F0F1 ATP synthase subunit B [Muribaculaceae bacterium]MDD5817509.1 F0F1 ATP synthase subunit B [bacterium]MDY4184764.1 F0F1 ATP synthase subunit B [Sodaliphilus sp.]
MELFKPEYGLVFWMFLAFACLYFILAKWAWPFIIKSMEERADLIDKGVAYAQEAKAHLDNAKAEANQVIAEARKQQADILRDAAKMKSTLIEEAKAAAAEEAKKVTEAAQVAIDQARKESEKQLRREVSAFALQIAEQVVRQNMANDNAQRALVEKLLNEVETKN